RSGGAGGGSGPRGPRSTSPADDGEGDDLTPIDTDELADLGVNVPTPETDATPKADATPEVDTPTKTDEIGAALTGGATAMRENFYTGYWDALEGRGTAAQLEPTWPLVKAAHDAGGITHRHTLKRFLTDLETARENGTVQTNADAEQFVRDFARADASVPGENSAPTPAEDLTPIDTDELAELGVNVPTPAAPDAPDATDGEKKI